MPWVLSQSVHQRVDLERRCVSRKFSENFRSVSFFFFVTKQNSIKGYSGAFSKLSRNFLETFLKLSRNFLETFSKHLGSIVSTKAPPGESLKIGAGRTKDSFSFCEIFPGSQAHRVALQARGMGVRTSRGRGAASSALPTGASPPHPRCSGPARVGP